MWNGALAASGPSDEVPIGHITNGVHVHSWLAPQMHALYDRHMGADWARAQRRARRLGRRIDAIDDGELWETHQVLKARLLDFVRRRAVAPADAPRRVRPRRSTRRARRSIPTR